MKTRRQTKGRTRTTARNAGARPALRTTGLARGSRPAGRAHRGSAIAEDEGNTRSPRTRAERRTAAHRKNGPSRTRSRRHRRDVVLDVLNTAVPNLTDRALGVKRQGRTGRGGSSALPRARRAQPRSRRRSGA